MTVAEQNPVEVSATSRGATGHGAMAWLTGLTRSAEVRRGVLSLCDQAVVSGVNFATAVVIGRNCSKSQLGWYYLVWSLLMFARALQSNLVCNPYTVFVQKAKDVEQRRLSGNILLQQVSFASAIVLLLAGLLLVQLFGGELRSQLADLLPILFGLFPLVLLREFVRQLLFAHLRYSTALMFDSGVAVMQLGGLIVAAHFGVLTTELALCIMAGAAGLAAGGWFVFKSQPVIGSPQHFLANLKRHWGFGKWMVASQLTGFGFYALPWVLTLIHGDSATGTFAACSTIVGLMNPLVLGLSNFFVPRASRSFAEGGAPALTRITTRVAKVFVIALGGIVLLMTVVGNPLAQLVYDGKYQGVAWILVILSLGTLLDALSITAGWAVCAMERTRLNFVADLIQLFVTVVAAVFLVAPLGVLGAALALLVGRSITAATRWLFFLSVAHHHAEGKPAC